MRVLIRARLLRSRIDHGEVTARSSPIAIDSPAP